MAGQKGLVNGGEDGGGGFDGCFFHRRSSPMPAAAIPAVLYGSGWGFLCDLGHHFIFYVGKERKMGELLILKTTQWQNLSGSSSVQVGLSISDSGGKFLNFGSVQRSWCCFGTEATF